MIWCITGKAGAAPVKVLIDDNTRMSASVTKGGAALSVTTSAAATVASSAFGGKRSVKTKRGTNSIALARKLPKHGYRVQLQLVRRGGGRSAPLTLQSP